MARVASRALLLGGVLLVVAQADRAHVLALGVDVARPKACRTVQLTAVRRCALAGDKFVIRAVGASGVAVHGTTTGVAGGGTTVVAAGWACIASYGA